MPTRHPLKKLLSSHLVSLPVKPLPQCLLVHSLQLSTAQASAVGSLAAQIYLPPPAKTPTNQESNKSNAADNFHSPSDVHYCLVSHSLVDNLIVFNAQRRPACPADKACNRRGQKRQACEHSTGTCAASRSTKQESKSSLIPTAHTSSLGIFQHSKRPSGTSLPTALFQKPRHVPSPGR